MVFMETTKLKYTVAITANHHLFSNFYMLFCIFVIHNVYENLKCSRNHGDKLQFTCKNTNLLLLLLWIYIILYIHMIYIVFRKYLLHNLWCDHFIWICISEMAKRLKLYLAGSLDFMISPVHVNLALHIT